MLVGKQRVSLLAERWLARWIRGVMVQTAGRFILLVWCGEGARWHALRDPRALRALRSLRPARSAHCARCTRWRALRVLRALHALRRHAPCAFYVRVLRDLPRSAPHALRVI